MQQSQSWGQGQTVPQFSPSKHNKALGEGHAVVDVHAVKSVDQQVYLAIPGNCSIRGAVTCADRRMLACSQAWRAHCCLWGNLKVASGDLTPQVTYAGSDLHVSS